VDDRVEQIDERAAAQVVFPPDDFCLQRLQAGQGRPADRAWMHPVDRRGGKARQRQVVDDGLERPRPRRAQLRRNGELAAHRGAVFLRGDFVASERSLEAHLPVSLALSAQRGVMRDAPSHRLRIKDLSERR